MKMDRIVGSLSRVFLLVTIFLSNVGCAAMTEPKVKAYIQEKKAYADIKKGNLEKAAVELKLALGNDHQRANDPEQYGLYRIYRRPF